MPWWVDTQCAISSWFTLFCYDVICNNFGPNLVIQHLAPVCGCTDRSLCYSTKIITSTNQHIYNFVHQNMLYIEKIYTCVYCCWCSSKNMYIRVQKHASIYYLQNSTQFILLLDPPTGSQYNTDSELCRVKRKLLYEAKQSIAPISARVLHTRHVSWRLTFLVQWYLKFVYSDLVTKESLTVVNDDRSCTVRYGDAREYEKR